MFSTGRVAFADQEAAPLPEERAPANRRRFLQNHSGLSSPPRRCLSAPGALDKAAPATTGASSWKINNTISRELLSIE